MAKKRVVLELTEIDHLGLVAQARESGLTIENFLLKLLDAPLRRDGAESRASRQKPATKTSRKRDTARARKRKSVQVGRSVKKKAGK